MGTSEGNVTRAAAPGRAAQCLTLPGASSPNTLAEHRAPPPGAPPRPGGAHPAPPPRGRARWGGTGRGSREATSRGGSGARAPRGRGRGRRGGAGPAEKRDLNPKRRSVEVLRKCRLPAAMEVTRGWGPRDHPPVSAWPPATGRLSAVFCRSLFTTGWPRRPLPGPGSPR